MGITATADAMVSALEALDFGQPKVVVRAYLPSRDREELSLLTLTVMPRGIERTLTTRGGAMQIDHLIEVAVQKKIEGADEAALAAGVEVVEAVADALGQLRVAGSSVWSCVETRVEPLMSEEHASALRVYSGVVHARLRSHA